MALVVSPCREMKNSAKLESFQKVETVVALSVMLAAGGDPGPSPKSTDLSLVN